MKIPVRIFYKGGGGKRKSTATQQRSEYRPTQEEIDHGATPWTPPAPVAKKSTATKPTTSVDKKPAAPAPKAPAAPAPKKPTAPAPKTPTAPASKKPAAPAYIPTQEEIDHGATPAPKAPAPTTPKTPATKEAEAPKEERKRTTNPSSVDISIEKERLLAGTGDQAKSDVELDAQVLARKQIRLDDLSAARLERETKIEKAELRADKKEALSVAIKRRGRSSLRRALKGKPEPRSLKQKMGR